jgi:Asp-tRNA(Asn)/Glu-tRNA(Gln) amidotransferase A subunit family amidase
MTPHARPSRRELFAAAAALGIGTPAFHRAVAAAALQAEPQTITPEMIKNAEWVAGIELTEAERKATATALTRLFRDFGTLHKVEVGNHVPPAVQFIPDPAPPTATGRGKVEPTRSKEPAKKPASGEDLAFLPLTQLAELVRTRQVTATELAKLYVGRLMQYDPALKCVVTLTDELTMKQAAEADKEIAAGKYRGPLHGIPWAAKDLIAYPGFKTTWGAAHFKDQVIDEKATVATRLEDAGAVMAMKATLGALANGDQWFGGQTRNPWNVKQGSSGSSAGTASAVAAGLVGFGIGSETLGSIVSPCTRCGVTGLRPTFGRVSRHGCMALSWSMDKIGPIARSVEDCALVFGAIHGADGKDPTAVDRPFEWPCRKGLKDLRVGYVEGKGGADEREELKVLKDLGVRLVPITLPSRPAAQPIQFILSVEASAAFDDITRAGVGEEGIGRSWPTSFRRGRFVPAVEYLRAQRVRTLLMREMARVMESVDLYVGGNDLLITNLTGHPTAVLPNGLREAKGTQSPTAITFTGRLWGESELLAVAKAYQDATGHHLKRPDMSLVTKENAEGKGGDEELLSSALGTLPSTGWVI